MSSSLVKSYRELFLDNVPLIDLRAPIEFSQGAFPSAVNLPLMTDQERAEVGTCYKNQGRTQALALGHQLVSGTVKNLRVQTWKSFVNNANKPVTLYCFRGGLRSRISQQWLKDVGVEIAVVEGGYKALRRFLIEETARIVTQNKLFLLTGNTGSGKTKLLNQHSFSIDLEGIAHHRGSSFGSRLTEQPTQIDFENQLAVALLKHESRAEECLLLEDEGRLIGARSIPLLVKQQMDQADLILIEESLAFRVEQIYQDYVVALSQEFELYYPNNGLQRYQEFLLQGCQKIAKRLGGVNSKKVTQLIQQAIQRQKNGNALELHQDWIHFLLKNYYDPMYRYQIAKKQSRVVFRGNSVEIGRYLSQLTG
jgi:tRNA 2-selenouridine synthase